MTRVLGVDPGLASCGWAVVRFMPGQKPHCERSGTLCTAPGSDTAARVVALGQQFNALLDGIDLVAIEAWTFQGPDRTHATATTIPRVIERFLAIAQARGIATMEITQQVAKAALNCRDKKSVRRAVELLVDHAMPVKTQHAADAIAVAIAGERKRLTNDAIGRVLGRATYH